MVDVSLLSERGKIDFNGLAGPILIPEEEPRRIADWTYLSSGTEVTTLGSGSPFVRVRFDSKAAADTGVDDEHLWEGTLLLTKQGASYPPGASTVQGPRYAHQHRSYTGLAPVS